MPNPYYGQWSSDDDPMDQWLGYRGYVPPIEEPDIIEQLAALSARALQQILKPLAVAQRLLIQRLVNGESLRQTAHGDPTTLVVLQALYRRTEPLVIKRYQEWTGQHAI